MTPSFPSLLEKSLPLLLLLFLSFGDTLVDGLRVGVIGGGVGGSASAYFLRQSLGEELDIDLFERTSRIGGRLYSKPFEGHRYEAGGSILHPKNKYAVSLAQEFGLLHANDSSGLLGIYDGKEFVFEESKWQVVTLYRLLRRYGLDMVRVHFLINQMLDDFEWIYFLQEKEEKTFERVDDLLEAMSLKFPNLTKITMESYLRDQLSVGDKTIRELIEGITLVNYGQSVSSLHGFVGSVSVAGGDAKLWSVAGGNERLPQELSKRSKANIFLENHIKSVTLLPDGRYSLIDANNNSIIYDALVVAHPLPGSDLTFKNLGQEGDNRVKEATVGRKYHQTIATFVSGKRKDLSNKVSPEDVIVCEPSSFFFSLSRLLPVDSDRKGQKPAPVYKIFSKEPLTQGQLDLLFERVDAKDSVEWLAYPEYRVDHVLPHFILTPGLYNVNAIEWAASAIEMSLIGAKNAALLVKNHLNRGSSQN